MYEWVNDEIFLERAWEWKNLLGGSGLWKLGAVARMSCGLGAWGFGFACCDGVGGVY